MAEPFICEIVSMSVALVAAQPPPLKGPNLLVLSNTVAGHFMSGFGLGLSIHCFSTFNHFTSVDAVAGAFMASSALMPHCFSLAARAFSLAFGDSNPVFSVGDFCVAIIMGAEVRLLASCV